MAEEEVGSRTEDIRKEVDSHKEEGSHKEEDIHIHMEEAVGIRIHKEEDSRMEAGRAAGKVVDRAAGRAEAVAGGKELDGGRMGRMLCRKAFVRD
ncbi:hypothetical protein IW148_001612 [Coemansia sp. RSA 1199]|nr:hypothetical protein IW148_001612 [Coemansia sp. RSA 1199]